MTAGNVPYIFTAITTAVSAQVNANFAALVTDLNAIDAGQITTGTFAIARFPLVTLAKGGTSADLSATGPGVLVQATLGAAITAPAQLALARGGAAADLSATGPGLLQQATLGAAVTLASPGQLPATATNDSAASGKLGEFLTGNNTGAPVSLSNNTPTNLVFIALPAGDWDVYGDVLLNSSAGMTTTKGSVSTTNGGFSSSSVYEIQNAAGVASQAQFGVPIVRLSVAISTSVWLVALAAFPAGTVAASGTLNARRAR